MKALSIQQPWGSLIASGVKDVENRTSRMLVPPQRVLIHVGANSRDPEALDNLAMCNELPLQNAELIGLFDRNAKLPKSAIIGYVDVVDIVEDSKSIWAQYALEGEKPMQHYVLENAHLFKEPILNVKGRLGVWDIPEIDQNNLPECVEQPKIVREGKTLTVPCSDALWSDFQTWLKEASKDETFELIFNVTDENFALFANETEEAIDAIETNKVIFTHKGEKLDVEVAAFEIAEICDEKDELITYFDSYGREYTFVQAFYYLKK